MDQTIALQGRYPQPDLAAITRAAQLANATDIQQQNAPARSQLEALQLQNQIGGQNALAGYNAAAGRGDPNAINQLNGQPAMQKQMFDAFDGMSPHEFMQAKQRSQAFFNAAQHVKMFPDGSPEQEQAWGAAAKVLKDEGFIDDKQFNMMISAGPNDLMIQQAVTADQWVKSYNGKNARAGRTVDPAMEQAKLDNINARTDKLKAPKSPKASAGYPAARSKAAAAILKMEKDVRDTVTDPNNSEQVAAAERQIKENTQHILQTYGLGEGDLPATAPATTAAGNGIVPDANTSTVPVVPTGPTPVPQPIAPAPAAPAATAQPAPGSAPQAISEGQTATNPQTGAKAIYRNGQWEPL